MVLRDFASYLALAAALCACGTSRPSTSQLLDIDHVVALQIREDGRYSVVCDDGSREIVTPADIHANDVCPNSSSHEPSHIVSVLRRADGLFDVVCDDLRHLTATGDELVADDVCAVEPQEVAAFRRLCEDRSWGSRDYRQTFDYLLSILAEDNCGKAAVRALAVKELELWSWSLHPDMAPLAALPRLESLALYSNDIGGIPDFSPFADHKTLKAVRIGSEGSAFMPELAKIKGLRRLSGVGLLQGLELVPQLEDLSVNLSGEPDLAPLESLPNLKHLTVLYPFIGKLSLTRLKSFPRLESLDLQRSYYLEPEAAAHALGLDAFQGTSSLKRLTTDVLALGTISQITSLEALKLVDIVDRDLAPLTNLPHLQRLELENVMAGGLAKVVQIADKIPVRALSMLNPGPLDRLAHLEDLEQLDIRYSIEDQLIDLSGVLGHLPRLHRLTLSGSSNPPVRIELGHMSLPQGVDSFSCSACILSDPAALAVFPSIERLYLSATANADLSFLRDPSRLKEISVFSTALKNVEALRAAVHLERASLKVSGVPSLDFLTPLTALRHLEIFAPNAAATHALAPLTGLEELIINVLDPVPTLSGMKRLKVLLVEGAVSQSILGEGLSLPFLRQLDVRGGQVAGLAPAAFPRLRFLGLTGPGPHALAEFPDLATHPWLQDVRIWHSQISQMPSLQGSHMKILSLDESKLRALAFDAGPLRWLDVFGSLTAITPQFTAPHLASLQITFQDGVPVTADNCPPDHPVPQVASTCKYLINRP